MPHKHKRKRNDDDAHYELSPAEKAQPLSVAKKGYSTEVASQNRRPKRIRSGKEDDTPAAFKRLMAYQAGIKPKPGLDDGSKKPSKKDSKTNKSTKSDPLPVPIALPQIRPGERMNDFSARVDAALPVIGLAKKNSVVRNKDGIRRATNKAQRRQQNMQKEWREIDARWKEKVAEAKEEAEEEYDELWRSFEDGSLRKKKRNRGKVAVDDEGDPWAAVGKAKQASTKLVGLHDVVQDVPKLTVVPKQKMRTRNGFAVDVDNVPQASGSLKRREELNSSRRAIIQAYRDLSGKRTGPTGL